MESFGARLRREREQRGITLEEITSSTKIGVRLLRAIEEEHFEQLPGGIFNKGFVRAYARHLGLDEEQTIADYFAASGEGPVPKKASELEPGELAEIQAEGGNDGMARIPWSAFAAALLIVAFGFAFWSFYSRPSRKQAAAPETKTANRPAERPSAPKSTVASAASDRKQNAGAETAARMQPAGETQVASSNPQSGNHQPVVTSAVSAPTLTSGQNQTPVPTPGAFRVLIKVREDSWVTITADGKQIMQDTLVAPAEKFVEAQKEIVIKAGNVGALDFIFNGRRLPSQGDYGEVRALTFDANGLRPPTPRSDSPESFPR